MGDTRFKQHYARLKGATDVAAEIRLMSDEAVVAALAAASTESRDTYLSNVLATEVMNRMLRARAIASSIGEGVYVVDAKGHVAYVNEIAERLLGWSQADLAGKPAHDTFHAEDADGASVDRTKCPILSVLREGGASKGEGEVFVRRDGTRFPVGYASTAIVREGVTEGAVVIFHDVTERWRAEASLRSAEANTRAVLEGMLRRGRTRRVTPAPAGAAEDADAPRWRRAFTADINAPYARALNYDAADRLTSRLLWLNFFVLAVVVALNAWLGVPDVLPSPFGWRVLSPVEGVAALTLGAGALAAPFAFRDRGNHYAWRVSVALALSAFSFVFIFVTGGAIEAHFHIFMVLACLLVYADWRLQWIVLGTVLVHHVVIGQFRPEWVYFYGNVTLAPLAHALPTFATVLFTTAICHNQRSSVEALEHARRVLVDEVAERRTTEAALEENRQRLVTLNTQLERRVDARTRDLKAAVEELEAFSYSVAHDLRAPLRGVDYMSRSLLEDAGHKLDGNERALLTRLRGESRRLDQVVNGLLDLSRASRTPLHRERVDLAVVAREIVDDLRGRDAARDVDVTLADAATTDADPRLARVVLENLLGNAWKFTANAEPARIAFHVEDVDGERVFTIADNGAGFPPEKADALFTAFTRLHAESEFEGTGVGLATVKRIVERHGGRVWAEGKPGEGATFRFTLPDAAPADGAEAPVRTVRPSAKPPAR